MRVFNTQLREVLFYFICTVCGKFRRESTVKKDAFIRFIKFGIVGGSGVFVNQGIFALLTELLKLTVSVASPIAIFCAIVTNFFLNYHWTWGDRKSGEIAHIVSGFGKFFFSSAATALIFNYLPLLFMVNTLGWNKHLANIIGIGIASVANFLISHLWTFAHKKEKQQ